MAHKFAGMRVAEILRGKKRSIASAPLPSGSPAWHEFEAMTWEQIDEGARQNLPGYKTVRKLLTDQRFNR